MKLSNVSTAISILFAPTFVISTYYYDFESVAFAYMVFMLGYLILFISLKEDLKSISTPIIYFAFIAVAYMLSSMEFIKIIPALISGMFFLFFLLAYIQKKEVILGFAKKFNKRELGDEEQKYLANSDGYWAIVIFINTLIQIALVFYENIKLWAFYSSVGWYIYILIALVIQIGYGKLYISKQSKLV